MLTPLRAADIPDFTTACTFEHIFGSKDLTALRAYGLEGGPRFFLCREGDEPTAALYLDHGVLAISASEKADPAEIAELVRTERVGEVDTNYGQCMALHRILGGIVDTCDYMMYQGGPVTECGEDIRPGELPAVFDVLQRSHEYYQTHLNYEPWAADLERRLSLGLSELYQLELDGEVIGTGSIASEDDECGVVAAVAVVPEYRKRGLGSRITRYLVRRIQEKGKTPRLIAGYDDVARLYTELGFVSCGRWGELYL